MATNLCEALERGWTQKDLQYCGIAILEIGEWPFGISWKFNLSKSTLFVEELVINVHNAFWASLSELHKADLHRTNSNDERQSGVYKV